jgi:hypothetical protein
MNLVNAMSYILIEFIAKHKKIPNVYFDFINKLDPVHNTKNYIYSIQDKVYLEFFYLS